MAIVTALCVALVLLLPMAVIALLIARAHLNRPAAPPLPPVAPQWAIDPTGRHEYRYWDGMRWTAQVANAGVVVTEFGGQASPASEQSRVSAAPHALVRGS